MTAQRHQMTWGHRRYPAIGPKSGPKIDASVTLKCPENAHTRDLLTALAAAYTEAVTDITRTDDA